MFCWMRRSRAEQSAGQPMSLLMSLSESEVRAFQKDGYLLLRDVLSARQVSNLKLWAEEVHDWPVNDSSTFMPYDEINAKGEQVLSRTENFANIHPGLHDLLRGEKLMNILRDLSGEQMVLFKEKINYKFAGSGGFAAHIDAGAYTQVKNIQHLTILISVDAASRENGCVEVVQGSHLMHVPSGSDNCIDPTWVNEHSWTPVELEAGQVLVFGSYLAHRSAANHSSQDRRALYATYNCASEGDLHDQYYRQRMLEWPPTHLRKPGDAFEKGAYIHGNGTPMMSVALGHQLSVQGRHTTTSHAKFPEQVLSFLD